MAMVTAMPRIFRAVSRIPRPERSKPATAGGQGSGVFDDDNAALLGEADTDHWWFRSKAAFVATALRRTHRGAVNGGNLFDLGAGAGGVTALLGRDPERTVVLEGNAALANRAHTVHGLDAVRGHVDVLPFADGSASVVCLLDVIEHLEDPQPTLREAARVLAPTGRLVVNVPAHRWLWSAADVSLGHVRRYNRRMLAAELEAAGFRVELLTHVFSWLVLPVWLKRKASQSDTAELGLDQESPLIDAAAIVLTRIERSLIGRVPLPLGTSVLAIAEPRG
jgi:SAM-dependent methyltransferase